MTSNILIIDDDPNALKLLKDILTVEGHHVRPFNNGELALRSAEAEAPDLILLDIRMPGMDGFEVCRRLKENLRLTGIPVIFISAANDLEDKVRAFQAGGVDYITKPFQKEEVIARVKTHVMLHQSLREMKRITQILSKSEASLRMAQAIAHLGHWEWDAQSENFYWSEETYRIFGYEPQRFPANYASFLNVVHPDDRERVTNCLNQAQAGSGFDIEYKIVLPTGEIRVVHSKGQAVKFDNDQQPKIMGTIQYFPQYGQDQATMVGVIEDITERKQLETQLERQANTDFLTGCASRRHFLEHAAEELHRIHRYGGELSLLMLDLDHFKMINDRYGHYAGDLTLKMLVSVCRDLLREVDLMGRLGGEEFAIMLPETSGQSALEVARRLCKAVGLSEVRLPTQVTLHFTTSIGVASLSADDEHIESLIDRADRALYKAKREGRNRVCPDHAEFCYVCNGHPPEA
ncbi:MAG: diguanylate cyclase [Methylomonas sp.]